MKNIAFINLNTLQFDNVFITQVLNWLVIYDSYGIHFDLVMFKSIKKLFSNKNNEKEFIKSKFKNRLFYRYFISDKIPLASIFNFFSFFSILIKYFGYSKIVIQIRSPLYYSSLNILKKLFKNRLKIIFDSRGAIAEEYKYVSKMNNTFSEERYKKLKNSEKKMLTISDLVFCVSNALMNYHISNNQNLLNNKFFISPCNADPNIFYYSEKVRNDFRKKLGLKTSQKVFVYSGALAAPWHIPSKVFELFSKLQNIDNNYFFLILTNDIQIAQKYLQQYKINKNCYKLFSLKNHEVGNYLNASDLGILLRKDMPVNNVASPSKFAEYLMTGLPVLITKNIGDFSNFVQKNNCGTVISLNLNDDDTDKIKAFLAQHIDKQIIANLGKKYFSKKSNIENKINRYLQLIKNVNDK